MAVIDRQRNTDPRARALDIIRSVVFAELAGRRARVFLIGSCARGDWHQGSDIPYFVDVVDLGSADADLVAAVRREGVEWCDPNAA